MVKLISPRRQRGNSHERGQSLIEVLIATVVVGVIAIGIAVVMSQSVRNTTEVRFRDAATDIGQEVIEFFRKERARAGWPSFTAAIGDDVIYCMETIPSDMASLPSEGACADTQVVTFAGTSFTREAYVTKDSDLVRVEVTVSWVRNDDTESSIQLVQELRDWN